jgi:opacity protein-like surface antigen
MRGLLLNLAAIAALMPAAPAWAGDLPPDSPPVRWGSGLYAGAFLGGAFSNLTTRPSGTTSGTSAGVTTGTLVGYMWRINPWALGVEGDITANALTQKFTGAGGFPATGVDSIYALHARGRLGYTIGAFEPFIAAGLAYDRLAQYRQAPAEFDGASSVRPGWTIGAGVDARVQLPLLGLSVVRAEYLYEHLATGTFDLNGAAFRTGGGVQYVRLGLISYVGDSARPVVEPITADWSGSYVGAMAGWSHASASTAGNAVNSSLTASGGLVGLYSGHNWMFGNTVVGVDGSSAFASVRGAGPQPGAAATRYDGYFQGDLRGRAGYAWDRWLPYVAAGLLFDESAQYDSATGNSRGAVYQVSGTIGAGVEYMLTDRVALRGEYAYARSFGPTTTRLDSETCCDQSRDSHSLRFGIGYFFH